MKKLPYSADDLRKILETYKDIPDMEVFGLSWGFSVAELKRSWKALAEKYHPNQYDPKSIDSDQAELLVELIQIFSSAYRHLKKEAPPIELLPPPDKIGTWKDPLKKKNNNNK